MADTNDVSVAAVLRTIASQFPVTETVIQLDTINFTQLLQASPRRVAIIFANTSGNDHTITTNTDPIFNSGMNLITGQNEKLTVKDWGGLVMMPWFCSPAPFLGQFITVFEVYSTRG